MYLILFCTNIHFYILVTCFLSLCQGERSFFLQPGERLEQGIQDVYVLSEEEGLVLRAVEAFNDTQEVRNHNSVLSCMKSAMATQLYCSNTPVWKYSVTS